MADSNDRVDLFDRVNPRDAAFVHRVFRLLKDRDTLPEIIRQRLVKQVLSDDGPSVAEQAIIATVVSLMQDRIISLMAEHATLLRKELEAQRQLVVNTLRGVRQEFSAWYALPLFTAPLARIEDRANGVPKAGDKLADNATSVEPSRWTLPSIINWGNLVAGAALVIVAIAFWYTKVNLSWKDRVEVQNGIIDEKTTMIADLRREIATRDTQSQALQSQNQGLSREVENWHAAADAKDSRIDDLNTQIANLSREAGKGDAVEGLRKQLEDLNSRLQPVQDELERTKIDLASARGELNAAVANFSFYKKLYNDEVSKSKRLEGLVATLQQDGLALRRQVDLQRPNKPTK